MTKIDIKAELEVLNIIEESNIKQYFTGNEELVQNKIRCLCLLPTFKFSLRKVAKHMGLSESYFLVQSHRDISFKETVELVTQFRQTAIEDKFYDLIDDTDSDTVKADLLKFYLERKGGWNKTTHTDITTKGEKLTDIQIIEISTPKIINDNE